MPDANLNDDEFLSGVVSEDRSPSGSQRKVDGAGGAVGRDPLKAEEGAGSFGDTPPAQKRRGRPPGSRSKAKAQDSFGSGVDLSAEERDRDLKKRVDAMAATIRGRQMMVGFLFGVGPDLLPGDDKVQAEALAWIRFQQEFPAVKLSPKADAIIGLAAASCASYMPMIAVLFVKAKMAQQAKRQAKGPLAFGGGPVNQPGQGNGLDTSRASPTGEETVILSGVVPDDGKLKFN
jgi:hypothetical protein